MFHDSIIGYINSGGTSKNDFLIGLLFPSLVFKKNAKRLTNAFLKEAHTETDSSKKSSIQVDAYRGSDPSVKKMMSQIGSLQEDLVGAYLHGSLATQEEIAYSDFDALVILKDEVFKDSSRLSRVGIKLNRLQKVMHEFDPLQHHGWFVLTEGMLKHYPTAYFPLELFKHTVSLLVYLLKDYIIFYTYGEEYMDATKPFVVLTINAVIGAVLFWNIPLILSLGMAKFRLVINLISLICGAAVAYLCIPEWGTVGAVFGLLTANGMVTIIFSAVSYSKVRVR